MNDQQLTQLLHDFQCATAAWDTVTSDTPREVAKPLYEADKAALKALMDGLRDAVPFEMIRGGDTVATVRTMGCVTSPGNMLNYSSEAGSEWVFSGQSLTSVDEIRVLDRWQTKPINKTTASLA